MKVAFRVDSSTEIGTGHVMRCLTLAEALRSRGASVIFICRVGPGDYVKFIRSQGFEVAEVEAVDADLPTEAVSGADWLVVDHYGLDAAWERRARSSAGRLMVIDDLANRRHEADLLLDQNFLPSMETRYTALVPKECRLLLGPSYALLRPEFETVRARSRDGRISRVLLFFGGADPYGLTQRAIKVFGQMKAKPAVGVVIGLAHLEREAIEFDCRRFGFTLHVQTDRMASLLDAADLIVGGGGTTTWERCKLGVPSMTVIVADNQREITRAVAARGATVNLGDASEFSEDRLAEAFQRLAANPDAVRRMSNNALALMGGDGAGAQRVIDVMGEIKP